jgi:hypothetical protein
VGRNNSRKPNERESNGRSQRLFIHGGVRGIRGEDHIVRRVPVFAPPSFCYAWCETEYVTIERSGLK